jgi:hypothetical protein
MQRVQELRQQVRDKVQNLLQLRQSTIQRAISITERQVAVLSLRQSTNSSTGSTLPNDMEIVNESGHHPNVTTKQLLEQHQTALLHMKDSFMNLYEMIQNSTSNTTGTNSSSILVEPTQLQKEYQNTIHVIEQGLQQGPSNNNITTSGVSQIEQAIYRRDYMQYDVNDNLHQIDEPYPDTIMNDRLPNDETIIEDGKNNDPEQTLFHLLCR